MPDITANDLLGLVPAVPNPNDIAALLLVMVPPLPNPQPPAQIRELADADKAFINGLNRLDQQNNRDPAAVANLKRILDEAKKAINDKWDGRRMGGTTRPGVLRIPTTALGAWIAAFFAVFVDVNPLNSGADQPGPSTQEVINYNLFMDYVELCLTQLKIPLTFNQWMVSGIITGTTGLD